jgi:hypothetical protein
MTMGFLQASPKPWQILILLIFTRTWHLIAKTLDIHGLFSKTPLLFNLSKAKPGMTLALRQKIGAAYHEEYPFESYYRNNS